MLYCCWSDVPLKGSKTGGYSGKSVLVVTPHLNCPCELHLHSTFFLRLRWRTVDAPPSAKNLDATQAVGFIYLFRKQLSKDGIKCLRMYAVVGGLFSVDGKITLDKQTSKAVLPG